MRNFIHNLREKPEHERRVAAFGITSAIMSIVFILWASTLMNRISEKDEAPIAQAEEKVEEDGVMQKGASAVSSVIGGVSDAFNQTIEYVGTLDDPVTYTRFEEKISDELEDVAMDEVMQIPEIGTTTDEDVAEVESSENTF